MMASAMMQTSSGTGTVSDLAPGKQLLCLVTNLKPELWIRMDPATYVQTTEEAFGPQNRTSSTLKN
jgi:hypothetical protein